MSIHPIKLKIKGWNLQLGKILLMIMPETTGISKRKKGVFPINVFMEMNYTNECKLYTLAYVYTRKCKKVYAKAIKNEWQLN